MSVMKPNELLEQLQWRGAVKKFDPTRKISDMDWKALTEALRMSPSSYGLQPWKFLVVTSADLRNQLRKHSWDQTQVTDCSHYVVLCAKETLTSSDVDHYVETIQKVRGVTRESLEGYRGMMLGSIQKLTSEQLLAWNTRQVYIALGNLMTSAAVLGVDTCPMEGFDPTQYDQILGLKAKGLRSVVCCALGYRHSQDPYTGLKKVRFDASEVIETK